MNVTSVTLAADGLEATFLPELGMVGTSLCRRGEEFVALPGGLAAYRDRHQTGLPLLAPWANRLDGWSNRVDGIDGDTLGIATTLRPTSDRTVPHRVTVRFDEGYRTPKCSPPAAPTYVCLEPWPRPRTLCWRGPAPGPASTAFTARFSIAVT